MLLLLSLCARRYTRAWRRRALTAAARVEVITQRRRATRALRAWAAKARHAAATVRKAVRKVGLHEL
jgi:hypothetical protein